MSRFYRFLLVNLFFLFIGLPSFAAISPSIHYSAANKDPWFSSIASACNFYISSRNPAYVNTDLVWSVVKTSGNTCYLHYVYPNGAYPGNSSVNMYGAQMCPSNSTAAGSACTCNAGYIEQGGQCVKEPEKDPCDGLAQLCSGSQGKSGAFSLSGKNIGVSFTCMSPLSFGANPLPGCSKGCMGEVGGYPTAIKSDSGTWTTQGIAKYSGATCDPSVINDLNKQADPEFESQPNPEPSKPPECTNGYQGTVNGVSVCVPAKASSGVVGTETKDNGDGTKTDTKTDVKCENGKCEVTKTSSTTNITNNTTVGTSSSTSTVDKAAYCNENKTAGVCKDENGDNPDGTGSFTGNCNSGFQCKGDAVQCAIAKEQHRRMCQIFDDKSAETTLFNQSKGKEGIQRGDEGSPIDLAGRISTDSLIGAGSCMSDFQIQFMDRPVNVKLSNLCPYLEMLGNILVAVGMVMAIRIVGVR